MAKHEIVIHENTGATKEIAPYLGSYVSKESIHIRDFATAIAAKCGLPAIQVQAVIDGAFTEIEKLEDEEIKLELADVTPTIISDEKLTKLRVDNVMDLAEERPMNLIHGRHVFRVAGFNMVLTDEGAAAFLQDSHGATFELVVDEVVSKQLFKAHTAALLEPGDYKLVVKSRAGDAEGPLQTSFRKVKYLKVEDPAPVDPPEIDSAASSDEPDGRVNPLQDVQIQGRHLAGGSVQLLGADGTVKYCAPSATGDDESLTAPLNYTGDKSELARVQVTTAGGTASIEVRFV